MAAELLADTGWGEVAECTAPAFLTLQAAAERLRVHRNTIYRAVERGDLPARRVGQQIRIPIEALTGPGQEVIERVMAEMCATRRRGQPMARSKPARTAPTT